MSITLPTPGQTDWDVPLNATLTELDRRLTELAFNVTEYGAQGDGTTDDTDAIQAAVNAIPSAGGTLFLPPGTYLITSAINLKPNVLIQGSGMNATIIRTTSTTEHILSAIGDGPNFITIRDLHLDGPGSGTGHGIHIETTTALATANIDITSVIITDMGGDGVNLDTPITSVLSDVRAQTCGGYGFNLNDGTSITLLSCYANGCGNGYNFSNMTYCAVVACACDNPAGTGYTVTNGGNIGFYSCGIEGATSDSFSFASTLTCTAVNCYVTGSNAAAFRVTAASDSIGIHHCREVLPGGGASAGIQVDAGSSAVLSGNTTTTPNVLTGSVNELTPTTSTVSAEGTATVRSDRAATNNFASFVLQTAGVDQWVAGLRNDSTDDLQILNTSLGIVALRAEARATATNIQLLSAVKSFGSGVGVIGITDASTVPSTDPAGGGILYSEGGSLKWRGSAGSVTIIAPA